MDAKETVKQGLQARKDVRAAEARAEKLREDLTAVNDARFREHMSHRKAKRSWQAEKEILVGTVYQQHQTVRELREENAELRRHAQEAKQLHTLIGAVKAVLILAGLVVAQDLGWIVSWLAASLMACTVTYLFFTTVAWVRGKV